MSAEKGCKTGWLKNLSSTNSKQQWVCELKCALYLQPTQHFPLRLPLCKYQETPSDINKSQVGLILGLPLSSTWTSWPKRVKNIGNRLLMYCTQECHLSLVLCNYLVGFSYRSKQKIKYNSSLKPEGLVIKPKWNSKHSLANYFEHCNYPCIKRLCYLLTNKQTSLNLFGHWTLNQTARSVGQ